MSLNSTDNSGDKSPEKPQNRLETKVENKERSEASKLIADGDLNKDISAQTLEKRLSRKSGATGYGVASADSLLPAEIEIQKMGKQLTAKMEQEKPIAVIAQNIGDSSHLGTQQPQVMTDAINIKPGEGWKPVSDNNTGNLVIGDQLYKPDEVTAQDWNQIKQMGRDAGEAALEKAGVFTHRGNEDKHIDYKAAQEAHKTAGLDKLALPKNFIGAIMRNEQHYYKTTDDEQDSQVREKGTVLKADGKEDGTASIGPAQIQIQNIRHLVDMKNEHGKPEYPYLQQIKEDPIRSALDPKNAALLVGAYTVEIAKEQKAHGIEKPSVDQIIYGYNDDVNSYKNGNDKAFVSVSAPKERDAEKLLHKDLKREKYPIDPRIVATSAHVRHVKRELENVNRISP
jgi:hypothetical protein